MSLLDSRLVVVVGVGTVGSQVAEELANSGIGRMLFLDHDVLEESNLVRHALPRAYIGMNKAEALTLFLKEKVPTLRPRALDRKVDRSLSDDQLDRLLQDADLIVAATDDREAQRRIGQRALALDIPALFPGLYGNDGGEVFVQRSPRHPCFLCWDGFRRGGDPLRSVTAINADTFAVIQLTVHLSLGILDPRSDYERLMAPARRGGPPAQLFVQRRSAALSIAPATRRANCPSCAVGPSPLNPTPWPSPEPPPVPDRTPGTPGMSGPRGRAAANAPPSTATNPTGARAGPSAGMLVGACLLILIVVGGGAAALKQAQAAKRAKREQAFLAGLPAAVGHCRLGSRDDLASGIDFTVHCRRATYYVTRHRNENETAPLFGSDLSGLPKHCKTFSASASGFSTGWSVEHTDMAGRVRCSSKRLYWCEAKGGVVGSVRGRNFQQLMRRWRRALPADKGQFLHVSPASSKPGANRNRISTVAKYVC